MKKKILALVLALAMLLSMTSVCFADETAEETTAEETTAEETTAEETTAEETTAEETTTEEKVGLENFTRKNVYKGGQFTDFYSSDWFAENVIKAYELGLIKGTSASKFNPKGNISVAETIVLACRLHSIYNGGTGEFTQGSPWYKVYVDYALANGIIPGTYSDYNAKISRANFAFILNNALPQESLKEINNVPAGALKDIAEDNRSNAIYNLYRAGVLTGSDKYGTFNPNSNIQRCEVATIVTRMADRTQRKLFILEEKPIVPETVTLAGTTSIRVGETVTWKASVAPASANQWVSWSSGNPGVATVDANGNIKGLKSGESNITATAVNGVKKTVLIKVLPSAAEEYAYYAGVDFRSIKRKYSSAKATGAYVLTFKNIEGDFCVLTYVQYRIVNVYSDFTLHNITKGTTISDPSNYYKKLAKSYYGNTALHYLNLQGDVLKYTIQASKAMLDILSTGVNSGTGVYVSASQLN